MRTINTIILSEIKARWKSLSIVVLLMIATIGFDLLAPWPFKILIDNVLSVETGTQSPLLLYIESIFQNRYSLGMFAILLYFVSTLSNTIFEYIKSILSKKVVKETVAHFSKRAFRSLESMSIGFYNEQQIGDFIYRLSYDVNALGDFLEDGLFPLISSSVHLIIAVTVMYYIDIKLTIFALMSLPFLAAGVFIFNHYINAATKHSEKSNSATFSFIEEALTHLRVVQAFSQEKKESASFNEKVDDMISNDVKLSKFNFLLSFVVGIVIAISYSIVILYGMTAVFAGTLSTGLLIVFIFYLDNLTNPLLSIIYAATSIRENYTKISRMEEFFDVKNHSFEEGNKKKLRGYDIRFENVSFYKEDEVKILDNISFLAEEGKVTAIFGASGSGKSTIANLILRFVEKPNEGRVLIGGVDAVKYDPSTVRNAISYVPQDINLFDDTIYNNLVFGNPKATNRAIKDAIHISDAADFINRLPGKLEFRVGEGGGFLSGGQKQRLMLARALIRNHGPIFVLDEIFSALDVKTRKKVMERLQKLYKNKTVIIISNIFDVIKQADTVVVLNQGKMVFNGNSNKLLKEASLYRMLLNSE
jgi:subfamily B ATP-binding cassette protein MsbA